MPSRILEVTDGVTNTGVVDPKKFHELTKKYDVRVFTFVMGNSANWPLMRLVGDASGGFAKGVSNDDDIIGEILLAKGKILHESLHHAELTISGLKLVLHPLLVLVLATQVFRIDPVFAGVAVVFAASPCGVNAYLFAERYREGVDLSASAVALSTGLAVVTATVWLAVLQALQG